MHKSIFSVPKMDCPSEINLIRTSLSDINGIYDIDCNLSSRQLTVYHTSEISPISSSLARLGLGASLLKTAVVTMPPQTSPVSMRTKVEKQALYIVLAINFAFFAGEVIAGMISHSMGLVADSLDMLADAIVYGLSLWAIGKAVSKKKTTARISGFIQLGLAFLGFAEVLRRFAFGVHLPDFKTMIIVSTLAMAANIVCLVILTKVKSSEAHIRASMIFTSNDVIINAGVILAGILVHILRSAKPDLIIGAVVFLIVIRGAFRILRLAR